MAIKPLVLIALLVVTPQLLATVAAQTTSVQGRAKVSGISSDKYTEYAPTVSADGKTLIFEWNKNKTAVEGEQWELFESRLSEDGSWSEPYPLTAINEKCNFLAGPSLSYDGNIIYFTAFIDKVTTSEDIFYSKRLDDKTWSAPIDIGKPINTEGYEGFPSISADGRALYFVRINEEHDYDKKSKESCFKLFVSHKTADGSWGEPVALPNSINAGCERDPKIMADNHTLIFSSIREGGKGKFDMYQSRLLGDGSWTSPQPLDFINSPENDQSPCIAAAGDVMFFCSNNDIYSVGIPKEYRQMINITVQGVVTAADSKAPLAAELRVIDTNTNTLVSTVLANAATGHYSLLLSSQSKYRVEVINKLYFVSHVDFDFTKEESYKEVKHDIELHSDYHAVLTVKDKDLGYTVNSFLWISDDNGTVVFKDTLRTNDFPFTIKLNANRQYALAISAPMYTTVNQTITFDAATFGPQMPMEISLEHEKVKFVTDVTDISTRQKTRTKVYYNNENRDEVIVAEAGEAVYLRKGDRYQVVTSSDKGYLFSSSSIVAGENEGPALNLTVTPVKEGASLSLNHITFPSNSAVLKESSFIELDRVTDLLLNNPGVIIEISAHTDDVGNDAYNMTLSGKRAQSVLEYLQKKKIDSSRLQAKGYGETKPMVPNDSEANRELNRRVELVILKVN